VSAKLGLGLLGKLSIGLALVGLAGGGYYALRAPAPAAQVSRGETAQPVKARGASPGSPHAVSTSAPDALPSPPAERSEPAVASAAALTLAHDGKSPASRPSAAPRSSLADEVKTMRQVDAAMRAGDVEGALTLLGPASNNEGSLKEERAAARVFALCQLGRTSDARSEADRFAQRFPRSPLLGRVRSGCATR
jgi:hypothetical protein